MPPQLDFLPLSAPSSVTPATALNHLSIDDPSPVAPAKTTTATNAPTIAYSRRSCPSVDRSQRNLGTMGGWQEAYPTDEL